MLPNIPAIIPCITVEENISICSTCHWLSHCLNVPHNKRFQYISPHSNTMRFHANVGLGRQIKAYREPNWCIEQPNDLLWFRYKHHETSNTQTSFTDSMRLTLPKYLVKWFIFVYGFLETKMAQLTPWAQLTPLSPTVWACYLVKGCGFWEDQCETSWQSQWWQLTMLECFSHLVTFQIPESSVSCLPLFSIQYSGVRGVVCTVAANVWSVSKPLLFGVAVLHIWCRWSFWLWFWLCWEMESEV